MEDRKLDSAFSSSKRPVRRGSESANWKTRTRASSPPEPTDAPADLRSRQGDWILVSGLSGSPRRRTRLRRRFEPENPEASFLSPVVATPRRNPTAGDRCLSLPRSYHVRALEASGCVWVVGAWEGKGSGHPRSASAEE